MRSRDKLASKVDKLKYIARQSECYEWVHDVLWKNDQFTTRLRMKQIKYLFGAARGHTGKVLSLIKP
jgi:hypothetical protein